jgi:hypothetical protein
MGPSSLVFPPVYRRPSNSPSSDATIHALQEVFVGSPPVRFRSFLGQKFDDATSCTVTDGQEPMLTEEHDFGFVGLGLPGHAASMFIYAGTASRTDLIWSVMKSFSGYS